MRTEQLIPIVRERLTEAGVPVSEVFCSSFGGSFHVTCHLLHMPGRKPHALAATFVLPQGSKTIIADAKYLFDEFISTLVNQYNTQKP